MGGFFRHLVLTFVKNNAKNVFTNAVGTGMEVMDDVLEGRSLKECPKSVARGRILAFSIDSLRRL